MTFFLPRNETFYFNFSPTINTTNTLISKPLKKNNSSKKTVVIYYILFIHGLTTLSFYYFHYSQPIGQHMFDDELEYADFDFKANYGPINYKAASIYAMVKKDKNGKMKTANE